MDPLSVSGLAISVVSLTFQIFSGCVAGYQLFLEAKGMPKRYHYLRLRLRMEQLKLIDWAETANIAESDEAMGISLRSNRHIINDILHQIETLLLDTSSLSARYGLRLTVEEFRTITFDAETDNLVRILRLLSSLAEIYRCILANGPWSPSVLLRDDTKLTRHLGKPGK